MKSVLEWIIKLVGFANHNKMKELTEPIYESEENRNKNKKNILPIIHPDLLECYDWKTQKKIKRKNKEFSCMKPIFEFPENTTEVPVFGYLEIIMGPMFSGKTTALIAMYYQCIYRGQSVFVINHSGDTRYSDKYLVSHNSAHIPCVFSTSLSDIWSDITHPNYEEMRRADVILVNEAQFMPDIYKAVLSLIEIHKKHVYLYGLDGDFKRNPFIIDDYVSQSDAHSSAKGWLHLIPHADHVQKLKANCKWCSNSAIFSHRLSKEKNQVVIGVDNYVPLCRNCYYKENIIPKTDL
jgi:thymidine kinase